MRKIKILIVEDDPVLQQVYEEALPDYEYEKKLTSDGYDALTIYESWSPDIIILDIGLEELNGYFILKKIRQYLEDEDTTIIIASGAKEKSMQHGCIRLGISAYIEKPFKYEEINDIVKKAHESGKMTIT